MNLPSNPQTLTPPPRPASKAEAVEIAQWRQFRYRGNGKPNNFTHQNVIAGLLAPLSTHDRASIIAEIIVSLGIDIDTVTNVMNNSQIHAVEQRYSQS